MARKIIVILLIVIAFISGGAITWYYSRWKLPEEKAPADIEEKIPVAKEEKKVVDEDIQKQIQKDLNLPQDATNIKFKSGNFNEDTVWDAVVLYERQNIVVNSRGDRGTKQFLETYLSKEGTYVLKRKDEGFPEFSWSISEPKIVDFDANGLDEIFVLKTQAGTGSYKSYYVMSYRNGEMIDISIDKELRNKEWGGGRELVSVGADNILRRTLLSSTETDPNCCPSGPEIRTTWKLAGGQFVVEKEEVVFAENINRALYTNDAYGFSFQYPSSLDPAKFLEIRDYTKEIEEGPGAFYEELFKIRWQNRLSHKAGYRRGDSCVNEDVAPVTDYDVKDVQCSVWSLDPLYVIKYVVPDSTDYTILIDKGEIVFSFPRDYELTFKVISNTFRKLK